MFLNYRKHFEIKGLHDGKGEVYDKEGEDRYIEDKLLLKKYRVWEDMATIILLPNYNIIGTPCWSHVEQATYPNLTLSNFSNIWF